MTQPYNDELIEDNEKLLRIVRDYAIKFNGGTPEFTSLLFTLADDGGMSVYVESDLTDPSSLGSEYSDRKGIAYFTAGDARKLGMMVGYDSSSGGIGHAQVWPVSGVANFKRKERKEFKSISNWYVVL